jgi:preprotein translocase subunit YajC
MIRNGTPKLRTERTENVFGGRYGKIKDIKRKAAEIALKTNTILSIRRSFFIQFICQT